MVEQVIPQVGGRTVTADGSDPETLPVTHKSV